MSQIRLYLDEDALQTALLESLQRSSVDVMTVADADRLSFSDKDQLIWAARQQCVIYSFNMGDFHQLHSAFMAEATSHSGIILAPQQRYSIREQLRGLLRLMVEKSAEEMTNQLIFLSAYIRND
ncbi:MAG: DUF5615 family PIN-like protein [Phormidesmis sp.]